MEEQNRKTEGEIGVRNSNTLLCKLKNPANDSKIYNLSLTQSPLFASFGIRESHCPPDIGYLHLNSFPMCLCMCSRKIHSSRFPNGFSKLFSVGHLSPYSILFSAVPHPNQVNPCCSIISFPSSFHIHLASHSLPSYTWPLTSFLVSVGALI